MLYRELKFSQRALYGHIGSGQRIMLHMTALVAVWQIKHRTKAKQHASGFVALICRDFI